MLFWIDLWFSDFSKTSLNICKSAVHVLSKPGLENFEHNFISVPGGQQPQVGRLEEVSGSALPCGYGDLLSQTGRLRLISQSHLATCPRPRLEILPGAAPSKGHLLVPKFCAETP